MSAVDGDSISDCNSERPTFFEKKTIKLIEFIFTNINERLGSRNSV